MSQNRQMLRMEVVVPLSTMYRAVSMVSHLVRPNSISILMHVEHITMVQAVMRRLHPAIQQNHHSAVHREDEHLPLDTVVMGSYNLLAVIM